MRKLLYCCMLLGLLLITVTSYSQENAIKKEDSIALQTAKFASGSTITEETTDESYGPLIGFLLFPLCCFCGGLWFIIPTSYRILTCRNKTTAILADLSRSSSGSSSSSSGSWGPDVFANVFSYNVGKEKFTHESIFATNRPPKKGKVYMLFYSSRNPEKAYTLSELGYSYFMGLVFTGIGSLLLYLAVDISPFMQSLFGVN